MDFDKYERAIRADLAFHDALVTAYGWAACDARYDERGKATPELRALEAKKRAADEEWLTEMRKPR